MFLNIRMATGPNTTAQGAVFVKAPAHSSFGKVFHNNMDENSFSVDLERNTIEEQIELMISNGKMAIFHFAGAISQTQQFKNCQVSKKLIHLIDFLIINFN